MIASVQELKKRSVGVNETQIEAVMAADAFTFVADRVHQLWPTASQLNGISSPKHGVGRM